MSTIPFVGWHGNCLHTSECCTNSTHANKLSSAVSQRLHSGTVEFHRQLVDCKYCQSVQYQNDVQWCTQRRQLDAQRKKHLYQIKSEQSIESNESINPTNTNSNTNKNNNTNNEPPLLQSNLYAPLIPPHSIQLLPPNNKIDSSSHTGTIQLDNNKSQLQLQQLQHRLLFAQYKWIIVNPTTNENPIKLLSEPIIRQIEIDMNSKNQSNPLHNRSILQFGTNGYLYDISTETELYNYVSSYITDCLQVLHIEMANKQFSGLWLMCHTPGATKQFTHRDYMQPGIISATMHLTDGHQTTQFSTIPFVPPYDSSFDLQQYEWDNMVSIESTIGTTTIFDGQAIHCGPGNDTKHNRYVIYIELLPNELINNQQHDSNHSAILAYMK